MVHRDAMIVTLMPGHTVFRITVGTTHGFERGQHLLLGLERENETALVGLARVTAADKMTESEIEHRGMIGEIDVVIPRIAPALAVGIKLDAAQPFEMRLAPLLRPREIGDGLAFLRTEKSQRDIHTVFFLHA